MLSWNWGEGVQEQDVEGIKRYIQEKINRIIVGVNMMGWEVSTKILRIHI